MSRLQPTLADYVVVAINPALVMGLVGSLMYFLLALFYHGPYPERLQFSLSMFVFAIVLISRISMEYGWDHAMPFGLALGLVEWLAVLRFADGGLLNLLLMAVCWWCAHKLTWDCTVIDETLIDATAPAEAQGLLETVGLDQPSGATAAAERQSAAEQKKPAEFPSTGWRRLIDRPTRRPHAPGVWVVYFSLASLPIFGFGQAWIPAADTARRHYAFGLLAVYVACGLALLLTTSFLALRRYLRSRRLEMPSLMAGNWLATGAVLIVGLLLLAALLPRPNAEIALSKVPGGWALSPRGAARAALGNEGTVDPQGGRSGGENHAENATSNDGSDAQGGSPNAASQASNASGQPASEPAKSTPANAEPAGAKANETAAQSQSDRTSEQSGSSQSGERPGSKQQNATQPSPASENRAQNQTHPGQSPQPAAPAPAASGWSEWLLSAFKWLLYAVLLTAAGYWGWTERERLLQIIERWKQEWHKFWAELLGRRPPGTATESAAAAGADPTARFSDFADPFGPSAGGNRSVRQVIQYTFAALEAWGRERKCARTGGQTPHEFAQQIATRWQPLRDDTRTLADLYCRAVYSDRSLTASSLAPLARLWRAMVTQDAPPTGQPSGDLRPAEDGRDS